MDVKFLDGGKGVVVVTSGIVGGDELIAANTEIYSRDLVAKPYLYELVDCDHIEGVNLSTAQIVELAKQDLEASQYMKKCVVAIYAKEDLPFALARIWQVYVETSGWDTHVFRVRSDAVSWVKERVLANFGVAVTLE